MNSSQFAVVMVVALSASAALAQAELEALTPPPPPPQVAPLPQERPTQRRGAVRPRPEVLARARTLEEAPNQYSMLAMPSLGAGNRGQLLSAGFPFIGVRLLFGVTENLDLGAGFDTFIFQMNEPRLAARLALVKGARWSFGATFEAGYAFFAVRASRESRGARWYSGRRNINLSPALVVAYQSARFRAARLFAELHYNFTLDTQPVSNDPLVGVPPLVTPGHNVGLKLGAELPLSPRTALAFTLGLEVMGREEDARAMPTASVGLVTSL